MRWELLLGGEPLAAGLRDARVLAARRSPHKVSCTYEVNETLPAHWGRPCRSLFIQIQLSLRTGESLQGPHAAGRAARREGSGDALTSREASLGPLGGQGQDPHLVLGPGPPLLTTRTRSSWCLSGPFSAQVRSFLNASVGPRKEQGGAGRGQSPGEVTSRPGTSRLLRGHAEGVPRATGTWPPTQDAPVGGGRVALTPGQWHRLAQSGRNRNEAAPGRLAARTHLGKRGGAGGCRAEARARGDG